MTRAQLTASALIAVGTLLLRPEGAAAAWGGDGCAAAAELRQIVESALELAPGAGRGSTAPGYSVAVVQDDCGTFSYAAGRRQVGPNRRATTATRQHIGSMTKPVATALTLPASRSIRRSKREATGRPPSPARTPPRSFCPTPIPAFRRAPRASIPWR